MGKKANLQFKLNWWLKIKIKIFSRVLRPKLMIKAYPLIEKISFFNNNNNNKRLIIMTILVSVNAADVVEIIIVFLLCENGVFLSQL